MWHHCAFVHILREKKNSMQKFSKNKTIERILRRTDAVVIMTQFESCVAVTLKRAIRIYARSVITDIRMPLAFIHVDTIISKWCQSVTCSTGTLEATLEISTFAIFADTFLVIVTFVNIYGRKMSAFSKTCER